MVNISNQIVRWLERKTDRTRSAENIESYVVERYMFLAYQYTHGKEAEDEASVGVLWRLHETLISLGWIQAPQNPFRPIGESKRLSRDDLDKWRKTLKDDRVIHAGVVKVGTGRYLDRMAGLDENEYGSFLETNLERLLNHVETRRGRSLRRFDRRLKEDKRWMERLDIVLLFIRNTVRMGDVRFLNAALKCTDEYYAHFRYNLPGPVLLRYLMALAEQESAFKELIGK